MYLTKEEEKILKGEYGPAFKKAMNLIVSIGDIFGADKLINIKSSQISGISYKNIGDAGLSFIEDFEKNGGKINTFATLNPAGMDISDWHKMNIPEDFAQKQLKIIDSFKRMGAVPTCTCTPYLIGNLPLENEHISWAESSAVSFANSILGAKTNREGGPISLASAMIGKTPNYGLHLDENRVPNYRVKVNVELNSNLDYSLLGYYLGKKISSGIPYIEGKFDFNIENMKSICAAGASSGNIALFYFENLNPLPKNISVNDIKEKIEVTRKELNEVADLFKPSIDPDIVTIGCPHATINEIRRVCSLLKNKKIKKDKTLWICTSNQNKAIANNLGYKQIIEKSGGIIAADTCMVVAPLEKMGFSCLASNSCKAAHYVPSTCKMPSMITTLEKCIEQIVK